MPANRQPKTKEPKAPQIVTQQELRELAALEAEIDTLKEKLADWQKLLLTRIVQGAEVEPDSDYAIGDYEIVITETLTGSARSKKLRIRQRGDDDAI